MKNTTNNNTIATNNNMTKKIISADYFANAAENHIVDAIMNTIIANTALFTKMDEKMFQFIYNKLNFFAKESIGITIRKYNSTNDNVIETKMFQFIRFEYEYNHAELLISAANLLTYISSNRIWFENQTDNNSFCCSQIDVHNNTTEFRFSIECVIPFDDVVE